ncbi:hypothetical protein BaRGS_00034322 [Batillaria attramentaria]|uniref:Uncharacterized protein n=1 Tax=Batillaria attramentaria TaxID=370345 RepID=A0ABD0JHM0_9CAEN
MNYTRQLSKSDTDIVTFSSGLNFRQRVSEEPARFYSARNLHGVNFEDSLEGFIVSKGSFEEVYQFDSKCLSGQCRGKCSKCRKDDTHPQTVEDPKPKPVSNVNQHRPLRRTRSWEYVYIPNLPYVPEVSD